MPKPVTGKPEKSNASVFLLLKPYRHLVMVLIALALAANAMSLVVPRLIASAIDAYAKHTFVLQTLCIEFLLVSVGTFLFTYLQNIMQTYVSERAARDLRTELSAKISRQTYAYVQMVQPSTLLTNLTADIDSIKLFVSQAVSSIVSSLFVIVGASILLLAINWRLALSVLAILPVIAATFFIILGKVRVLFKRSREIIDWLNKVINESILGAGLIRVLNSQQPEYQKFLAANTNAQTLGMRILGLFAGMIPIITFLANSAAVILLLLGGHYVISGTMTLGSYAAFANYLVLLIFPIFIIGFMSNIIAQAQASYARVRSVLDAPEVVPTGTDTHALRGDVAFIDVAKSYGEKTVLKNVSITMPAGTKTAIIGPTAAGKTQLLDLLTGLTVPDTGRVLYDGQVLDAYDQEALHRQIGFVFQDSVLFNVSVRENIAFGQQISDADMARAIDTAELTDFIEALPNKLETMVSERGSSLSGGQKQRIMLARALALNPHILLLDDFTARVDITTEQRILAKLQTNYPGLTLISVTQKIASVETYDQIVLLMEGEVIATGTHTELLKTCPEYVQIYDSQRSTSHYEVRTE